MQKVRRLSTVNSSLDMTAIATGLRYIKAKDIWKYSKEYYMLGGDIDLETAKRLERNARWFIFRERPNYDYENQVVLE